MLDDSELSFVGHNGDVDPNISSGTTRRDRPDRARGIHLLVGGGGWGGGDGDGGGDRGSGKNTKVTKVTKVTVAVNETPKPQQSLHTAVGGILWVGLGLGDGRDGGGGSSCCRWYSCCWYHGRGWP